jgi:glutamyl-tRNA synthetase
LFFFEAPSGYDEKTVQKRWKQETPAQMNALCEVLSTIDDFSAENTETIVKEWINSNEYNLGAIMNAFRLAVVGESKGPHMFDIIALIGKDETISRIKKAVEVLG